MAITRKFIEFVLEKFNMKSSKLVPTLLTAHFKLSSQQSPLTEKEMKEMKESHIPLQLEV